MECIPSIPPRPNRTFYQRNCIQLLAARWSEILHQNISRYIIISRCTIYALYKDRNLKCYQAVTSVTSPQSFPLLLVDLTKIPKIGQPPIIPKNLKQAHQTVTKSLNPTKIIQDPGMICQTLSVANALSFQASLGVMGENGDPSPADNPMAMAFRTKSKAACGHRPTRGNNPCHFMTCPPCPRNLRYYLILCCNAMSKSSKGKSFGKHRETMTCHDWALASACRACAGKVGKTPDHSWKRYLSVRTTVQQQHEEQPMLWDFMRLMSHFDSYIYNIIYTYVWGVQLHLLAPLHEFVHDMLALSKPCRSCSQYQLGAKTSLRLWDPGVSPSWTNNSSEGIIYTKYKKWLNNIGKYGTQLARYGYYILFVSSWFFLHDVTVHPKASCSMRQPALNTASMTSAGSSGSMLQTLAFRSNFSPETWPSSLMSYDVFDILFRATLAQPAQTWQWPWHGKTLACHPKTAWLPHSTLLSSFEKASWPGSDVPAHEVQEISAAFSHRIHHVAPSCTMFVAIGRSSRH